MFKSPVRVENGFKTLHSLRASSETEGGKCLPSLKVLWPLGLAQDTSLTLVKRDPGGLHDGGVVAR